ncbi:MAG: ATP-binding protein, partial [Desulfovibrionaceae bacterium]
MRFKDVTIKRKLLFNFGVMIAGIFIISAVTAYGMLQFRSVLDEIIYTNNRQNIAYKEAQYHIARIESSFHNLLSARSERGLAESELEFRQSLNALKGVIAGLRDQGEVPEVIDKTPGAMQELFGQVRALKSRALRLEDQQGKALGKASEIMGSAKHQMLTILDNNELSIFMAAEEMKARRGGVTRQAIDELLSRYHFPIKSVLDLLNGLNELEVLARTTALIRDEDFIEPSRERMVSILDGLGRNLEALDPVLTGEDMELLLQVEQKLEPLASWLVGPTGVTSLHREVLGAWRSYEKTMGVASNRITRIVDTAASMASDKERRAERLTARSMDDVERMLALVGGVFVVLLIFGGGFSYLINRSITNPLEKGVAFAEAISKGDLSASLEMDQKDEVGDLARALDHMASTLRRQDWMRSGKAGLDDRLRGVQEVRDLAARVVAFMVRYFDAQLGALYLMDDAGRLQLTASHAFTDRSGNFNRFKPGEGLVGQAGLEREVIFFSDVTEEAPAYNFGAGEKIPGHYLAVPLAYRDELAGVLLLGSVAPFPPASRSFVEENLEAVAIAIQAARSRSQVEELLDQTQQQAEILRDQQQELQRKNQELEEQTRALKESEATLQQQQEELRVTNEELAEQTRALKESQGRLQQQQEELKAANEELEERTKALEEQRNAIRAKNVQLKKAQKELKEQAENVEKASRYKSEFLANMSHELRTPLNSILILSRILSENQECNLSDKQLEFARTVHTSGKDLLNLINEILDLAKVESGRMEVHVSRVGASELLEAMGRLFEPLAERKGVAFELELAEDCPEALLTDSQRLTQILRNLLANAFKFTEQGRVALRVGRPSPDISRAASGLDPAEAVAFEVSDTGVGVPEDKREVIFEAFKQVDGTTSRKFGGTGLGLSISREFARLLGGEIRMKSEVGQGSTFTLHLPERLEPETEEVPEADLEADAARAAEYDAAAPEPAEACAREGVARDGSLLL